MIQVTKEFTFDSAHFLPNYYGKCERMHGHTFKLHITVEGPVSKSGLAIDFTMLKKIAKENVVDQLDHQLINDIIKVPSAENIAIWIWNQLSDLKKLIKNQLKDPELAKAVAKYFRTEDSSPLDTSEIFDEIRLVEVKLWETPTSFVTYRGSHSERNVV